MIQLNNFYNNDWSWNINWYCVFEVCRSKTKTSYSNTCLLMEFGNIRLINYYNGLDKDSIHYTFPTMLGRVSDVTIFLLVNITAVSMSANRYFPNNEPRSPGYSEINFNAKAIAENEGFYLYDFYKGLNESPVNINWIAIG